MVQEVGIIQNKAVVSTTPFPDKSSGNLVSNTGPFGQGHQTLFGAVSVFFVPVCSRQRPYILGERFAELVLVFENNSGLKSQERFVVRLAPQSADRAQRVV